jgi:hypothetical protein
MASGASLFLIFYIPSTTQMFRVEPPPAVQGLVAILLGALAVVWRFGGGRDVCRTTFSRLTRSKDV